MPSRHKEGVGLKTKCQGHGGHSPECRQLRCTFKGNVTAAAVAVFNKSDNDDSVSHADELCSLGNNMQGAFSIMDANKFPASTEHLRPCQRCQHLGFQYHMSSSPLLHLDAQLRLSLKINSVCEWGNHHGIIGAAEEHGMSFSLDATPKLASVI